METFRHLLEQIHNACSTTMTHMVPLEHKNASKCAETLPNPTIRTVYYHRHIQLYTLSAVSDLLQHPEHATGMCA